MKNFLFRNVSNFAKIDNVVLYLIINIDALYFNSVVEGVTKIMISKNYLFFKNSYRLISKIAGIYDKSIFFGSYKITLGAM